MKHTKALKWLFVVCVVGLLVPVIVTLRFDYSNERMMDWTN